MDNNLNTGSNLSKATNTHHTMNRVNNTILTPTGGGASSVGPANNGNGGVMKNGLNNNSTASTTASANNANSSNNNNNKQVCSNDIQKLQEQLQDIKEQTVCPVCLDKFKSKSRWCYILVPLSSCCLLQQISHSLSLHFLFITLTALTP